MLKYSLIKVVTLLLLINIQQISSQLSVQDQRYVSTLDDPDNFQRTLNKIMKPRVVGTLTYKEVQNYIIEQLEESGLQVELDSFRDETPIFGSLEFTNIIGRLNPNADKFLTLACHYDSKYFKNFEFLAATDSAVPCTVMLSIVKNTLPALKKLTANKNLGLMLIFFDGEEAFKEWSATDSLYGSRHLARKWANTRYKNGNELDRISVLVLLDLIGASNAKFYCTFANTCALNKRLSDIELNLKKSNSLQRDPKSGKIFQSRFTFAGVDDDHRPFMERNVPILHLIPSQFPKVWHKEGDNEINLNKDAISNIDKVLRAFVIDYISQCTKNPNSNYCNYR